MKENLCGAAQIIRACAASLFRVAGIFRIPIHGKVNGYNGAFTKLAANGDFSTMSFYNFLTYDQAQARSLAWRFGSDEQVEDLGQNFR